MAKEIESALTMASTKLGYTSLKDKQKEVITKFVSGRDVFATLPTGYGKSLCYGCLPLIYDQLRSIRGSIAVVVSPLSALMKDQVDSFRKRGISAAFVTSDCDEQISIDVVEGRYQLVFISPEQLISRERFRSMCMNECYTERLVAFVVDEAHCVKKWLVLWLEDIVILLNRSVLYAYTGERTSDESSHAWGS